MFDEVEVAPDDTRYNDAREGRGRRGTTYEDLALCIKGRPSAASFAVLRDGTLAGPGGRGAGKWGEDARLRLRLAGRRRRPRGEEGGNESLEVRRGFFSFIIDGGGRKAR